MAADRQDPVPAVLGAARQALGGDVALAAVGSFAVKGTRARHVGNLTTSEAVEFTCLLPDKFVEVTERTSGLGPLGTSSVTSRYGFDGDDPINDIETDSPLPPPIVAKRQAITPAEIAAERARLTNAHKHTFVQIALPLFAASFPSVPLTMTPLGQAPGPTGPADVIEVKTVDDFTWNAFFDGSTHLLTGLSWKAKPVVVMGGISTQVIRSNGQVLSAPPPPVLPGNPSANLDDVQWQLTIGDYRVADALNWPHRFTTSYGGRPWEDLKLGTFKLNPKIDPAVFRPMK
jgi:hypothetical protein